MYSYKPTHIVHIFNRQRLLLFSLSVTSFYVSFAALQNFSFGVVAFLLSASLLIGMPTSQQKYFSLLLGAILLMAINPINPSLKFYHILIMFGLMFTAVIGPYMVSHFALRQHLVHFNFDWTRKWKWWELFYLAMMSFLAYLIWPYFFIATGAYTRWEHVPLSFIPLLGAFIALMATGIWEEFFFIGVVFNILRRYLTFWGANILQAVAFTAFIYQMGFRFWAPPLVFIYAFNQGFMFEKTKSLLYVLTIHVLADLIIFFALFHAYYPSLFSIFITAR